jgi:hypothetical protein
VFGFRKLNQKPNNSSIKPIETRQWDELRFSSGGGALETEKRTWEINLVAAGIAVADANVEKT